MQELVLRVVLVVVELWAMLESLVEMAERLLKATLAVPQGLEMLAVRALESTVRQITAAAAAAALGKLAVTLVQLLVATVEKVETVVLIQ
jgi:hypothetical protein